MAALVTPLAAADQPLSRRERSVRSERLARRAHSTTDPAERVAAQRELVELNIQVARAVASRYRGRGVPLEDLEQVACEGLLKAVRRFDPSRDHDLLSYAVPTIRGEVLRYFRDLSWMVRPPRRLVELQGLIIQTAESLRLELGRAPTDTEVCGRLGVGRSDYDAARSIAGCFQPVSLDSMPPGSGPGGADDRFAEPSDPLLASEARAVLHSALSALSERDRLILHLRFSEGWTQREIGSRFGVSQVQVSRWLIRILTRLRTGIGAPEAAPCVRAASHPADRAARPPQRAKLPPQRASLRRAPRSERLTHASVPRQGAAMTIPADEPVSSGTEDLPDDVLPPEELEPETQGEDPLEAELGDDGQGDLAPEDL